MSPQLSVLHTHINIYKKALWKRGFQCYFKRIEMRKKKNSQQLTPDQNWLWVCGSSEKICFSSVTPKSSGLPVCGCAGNRHCWWHTSPTPVLAFLVSSAVLHSEPIRSTSTWHTMHTWALTMGDSQPHAVEDGIEPSHGLVWSLLSGPHFSPRYFSIQLTDCVWVEHRTCLATA